MPLDSNHNDRKKDRKEYLKRQEIHPGSQRVHRSSRLARIQARARPLGQRLHRLKIRLDEGAILRKRITVLTLVGLIFLSLIAGKVMSPPEQIISTSLGTKKEFISGNTIAPQKTTYDPNNHTARLDLETTSPTGVVSPQDLSVNYTPLVKPKSSLPAPQLYLIPTVSNHYIVIIRNLYQGFQALELRFHDSSKLPLAQYQDALRNGSNGSNDENLSNQSLSSLESNSNIGGLHLSDDTKNTILSSSTAANVQDKQRSLLDKISQNDTQIVIVKEPTLLDNHGQIPTTLSPKDISVHDINTQIKSLQTQINHENNDIKQNQILLAKMRKHSGTLSKDAAVDKNYKSEIDGLNQNITNTQNTIHQSHLNIAGYQKQIQGYKDELDQIQNDRIDFDAPVKQSTNQFNSR